MGISVKLQAFEGPLDLLLHLIEKDKIDIYDIPIVEITNQYLEYVREMEAEDMNLTTEFMVMAATLIDIKCRMLLPPDPEEEEEEGDPRDELVRRLLEYKKYKYMSQVLREKMEDAGIVLTKETYLPDEVKKYRPPVDTEELLSGVSLEQLLEIYEDILRKNEEKQDKRHGGFGRIEKEKVSIGDCMKDVQKTVIKKRKVSFRNLLEKQPSKTKIIVTFLAVLELIHYCKIKIFQEEVFGDILIESLEDENAEVSEFTEIEFAEL